MLLFVLSFGFVVSSLLPLAAGHVDTYVEAAMEVDRTEASPGDLVTFSIFVDPLRGRAKTFLVSNTLPEGLGLVSSIAPSTCARSEDIWVCTQKDLEAFTIEIRAVVEHGTEGTRLVDEARVWVWEDDDAQEKDDRRMIIVQATVRVVPFRSVIGALLEVRLTADQLIAIPGGELDYRIEVTNSGSAPATSVSVQASLPKDVALISASPSPVVRDDALEWNLAFLPVGSFTFLFTVRVPEQGDLLELHTSVTATYLTDGSELPHVRSAPQSALVILVATVLPPSLVRVVPISTIAAVIAGVAVSLLVAQRVLVLPLHGRTRVDQVFLLHRSGVVLKHYSSRAFRSTDSDIAGGMLAAIQMFVQDSVDVNAGPLREIRFGDRNLLFVRGENVTLAAVDAQGDTAGFVERATRFVGDLEDLNGHMLADFDGIAESLDDLDAAFRRFTKELARRNT